MSTTYQQCFNPFDLQYHRVREASQLRSVTALQLRKLNKDEMLLNLKICNACRIKVSKLPTNPTSDAKPSPSTSDYGAPVLDAFVLDFAEPIDCDVSGLVSSLSTLEKLSDLSEDTEESSSLSIVKEEKKKESLTLLNKYLNSVGQSPIEKRKLNQKSYPAKKMKQIFETIHEKSLGVNVEEINSLDKNSIILSQLKEEFHKTGDRNQKIRILTLFHNFTIAEIQQHFNATKHMIGVAKKTKEEKGILSCPNGKRGKRLDTGLVHEVTSFYELDEISRLMPGKKDCVTVLENGEKIKRQKRLILCNLKEVYSEFIQKFSDQTRPCGFSKFAEMRPKNCVLAGEGGTHVVCVCVIHQNVKLMIDGGKISRITQDWDNPIKTYRDCLEQITCNPQTADCTLNKCNDCPGIKSLIELLESAYEAEMIDTITYKQWVTVDRANLETMMAPVPDFLEKLKSALTKLLPHDLIAKQQSLFMKTTKTNLKEDECIVSGDFAENYAFVFQDAIQGVHWNNDHATIHPFVIYYKDGVTLNHKSFAANRSDQYDKEGIRPH